MTEHYSPEESEYMAESFGYDPLESTGREWYYLGVDELIYQKYSDKELRMSYLVFIPGIKACSREKTAGKGSQRSRPKNTNKWLGSDLDYPFYRQLLSQCTLEV